MFKKEKDELWWIHPKFKATQAFDLHEISKEKESSYILKNYKDNNFNDQNDSNFPVGVGKYADFAKILYKMNGYKTGAVPGWYAVVCLEKNKKWAIGQLRADPNKPLQIYEDLVFNNEKKAIDKAAELRIDNPGPTRLEETITGSPEERRKVESLELQRKFNLKLAGYRIKD